MVNCSKTEEAVTPSTSTFTGNWKHNGSVEKLAFTSNGSTKVVDLNNIADGSVIEFKADGTVFFEGEAVKYTITGTFISLNYTLKDTTIPQTQTHEIYSEIKPPQHFLNIP